MDFRSRLTTPCRRRSAHRAALPEFPVSVGALKADRLRSARPLGWSRCVALRERQGRGSQGRHGTVGRRDQTLTAKVTSHGSRRTRGQTGRLGGSACSSGTMPAQYGPSPARARSRAAIGASPGNSEGARATAQQNAGACPQAPPTEHVGQAHAGRTASTAVPAKVRAVVAEPETRISAATPAKTSRSAGGAATGCVPGASRWPPCAWAPDGISDAAIVTITAASQSAMGRADFMGAVPVAWTGGCRQGQGILRSASCSCLAAKIGIGAIRDSEADSAITSFDAIELKSDDPSPGP